MIQEREHEADAMQQGLDERGVTSGWNMPLSDP